MDVFVIGGLRYLTSPVVLISILSEICIAVYVAR